MLTPYQIGGGAVAIVNNTRILAQPLTPTGRATSRRRRASRPGLHLQRNGGSAAAPAGWTRLEESTAPTRLRCYGKVSDGTETTMAYDIGTSTSRDYVIIEVSGVTLNDVETADNSGSSRSITTGP